MTKILFCSLQTGQCILQGIFQMLFHQISGFGDFSIFIRFKDLLMHLPDARGVEIPYVDRDGKELKTVSERYYPAKGQKFFLKGGVIDNPKYEYRGPETVDFAELIKRGYQLPFYADLSRMPDAERRVIWGMMVGEEAKTKIPIFQNYTERGFDPKKHMLQSYGTGWQSASFLDQERQFFGAPGGIMHDWDLKTNIDGIYAAGD